MGLTLPKYGDDFLLRDFIAGDAQPLAEIEYDPEVKKYLAVPAKDRAEWIRTFSPDLVRGWAIEVTPEAVLAGRASISRASAPGEGELEIVIAKSFWGCKLGRKVAQILIPAAFEELNALSVVGVVHPEHRASLALLASWGFAYRGKKDCAKDHWQYGHLIFELTRTAYYLLLHSTATLDVLTANARDLTR